MLGISSMANGVVSPLCSLSPLPRMYPRTRNDQTSTPFRQLQLSQSKSPGFCFRLSDGFKEKSWAARVSAPLSEATFHEDGDEVDSSAGIPCMENKSSEDSEQWIYVEKDNPLNEKTKKFGESDSNIEVVLPIPSGEDHVSCFFEFSVAS